MEGSAHAGGEGVDGGQGPAEDDSLGGQEGHEVCEAVAEQGARLADGGGHFGDAVARGGQELGIVLVDEAGLGQVDADRVR